MKKHLHVIQSIVPGSIAEEMELQPGDTVLAINGQDIEDVFDYHYLVNDEYIEMLIRTADGTEEVLEIEKDYDEDIGIVFESSLMDDYRSCSNNCIFWLYRSASEGMRETMYFKDDDSRLSFLQGQLYYYDEHEGRGVGAYHSIQAGTHQCFQCIQPIRNCGV